MCCVLSCKFYSPASHKFTASFGFHLPLSSGYSSTEEGSSLILPVRNPCSFGFFKADTLQITNIKIMHFISMLRCLRRYWLFFVKNDSKTTRQPKTLAPRSNDIFYSAYFLHNGYCCCIRHVYLTCSLLADFLLITHLFWHMVSLLHTRIPFFLFVFMQGMYFRKESHPKKWTMAKILYSLLLELWAGKATNHVQLSRTYSETNTLKFIPYNKGYQWK